MVNNPPQEESRQRIIPKAIEAAIFSIGILNRSEHSNKNAIRESEQKKK
jgi:hypothetical protein